MAALLNFCTIWVGFIIDHLFSRTFQYTIISSKDIALLFLPNLLSLINLSFQNVSTNIANILLNRSKGNRYSCLAPGLTGNSNQEI